ncbi:hypothetical protein [Acinetobacter radioresistens]|jgi:hypothetical protein|uniref:Uncharacterized protein n=1 Tax=Acinetobacter radioresistens SK82 TaxID=596318 RepID=A0ABM9YKB2_ACIRA|nr:hypothetical protein [Acinetobacter radioresistens]EET81331.1 hypothetical protein ACIRA0001_0112 [Acinetobacter radioresistens SK82]ENV87162.1 hypothetical protein F940_01135 [Acinetobacter radioresistens NIPH 2130]MBA5699784.1 hypothetical protein [Acinetobacter radioresistens]MCK4092604.1 hypothetical protein [Acinetobacter radioresistens]MCK4104676.1 hypothetical protein [Acinetobacter radioresistens]
MVHNVTLDDLSPEERLGLEKIVNDAYDKILSAANIVLSRCLKSLNINYLRKENPTLSEILKQMKEISGLMQSLNQAGYVTFKAEEYVKHVQDIVEAVESGHTENLERHVRELNQRSFL